MAKGSNTTRNGAPKMNLVPTDYDYRTAAREIFASIKGQVVVGYRYGKAPEIGNSYNYADEHWEDGISMASVMNTPEINSFAVKGAKDEKKYYYRGIIQNTGSDGEITLKNVKAISSKEYNDAKKSNSSLNNNINTFLFYNSMIGRAHNIMNDYEHGWGDFKEKSFNNSLSDVLDRKIQEAAIEKSKTFLRHMK